MGKTNDKVVARQVFETLKDCKHVVRFEPHGLPEFGARGVVEGVDEISSTIYVSKRVLDLLGNPKQILVTVEASE